MRLTLLFFLLYCYTPLFSQNDLSFYKKRARISYITSNDSACYYIKRGLKLYPKDSQLIELGKKAKCTFPPPPPPPPPPVNTDPLITPPTYGNNGTVINNKPPPFVEPEPPADIRVTYNSSNNTITWDGDLEEITLMVINNSTIKWTKTYSKGTPLEAIFSDLEKQTLRRLTGNYRYLSILYEKENGNFTQVDKAKNLGCDIASKQ